jgi:hypothetical protein
MNIEDRYQNVPIIRERILPQIPLYFYDQNGEKVHAQSFFEKKSVVGNIRFHPNEYALVSQIAKRKGQLMHFNLQNSNHIMRECYVCMQIVGHAKTGEPLLDSENIISCECIYAKDFVSFDELKKSDFEFSFPHIKTKSELRDTMYERYAHIYNMSKEELQEKGVGMTLLEFE